MKCSVHAQDYLREVWPVNRVDLKSMFGNNLTICLFQVLLHLQTSVII